MYQFVLFFYSFMLISFWKAFFTFCFHWIWWTSPHKKLYNYNDEKKMNFQIHNDLQASRVIAISVAFKKLLQKRITF